MLDVYRSYYGLSGEPFRLGPDYRFSLHHTSYANAKAYLDYAVYQGEGFIAITGGPGTGKTTLISEILATLDRSRVQVATLTSTQLESRDLLYMVASAFGIHPDNYEKAGLLLELESHLVKKLRGGQRAMLIVDEAQGLSSAALEELRLLANLQYQYQLLLQICLVGQDTLLDLIRTPGMEHLQQRLVAATALEPLGFDETIDYIEHRLRKVGWKDDPAIDEAALRLVYCHSGGTPRRINLIVNRLFLHGGMEHKHRLNGEDAQSVLEGLTEEHLLPAQPLVEESTIGPAPTGEDGKPKARSLPRPGKAKRNPEPARRAASGGGFDDEVTRPRSASSSREQPGRSGRPATNREQVAQRGRADPGSGAQPRARQPQFAERGSGSPLDERLWRPTRSVPPPAEKRSQAAKYLVMIALLSVTAGAGWYLQSRMAAFDRLSQMVMGKTAVDAPGVTAPVPESSTARPDSEAALPDTENAAVTAEPLASAPEPPATVKGTIIREPGADGVDAGETDGAPPEKVPSAPATSVAQLTDVRSDEAPSPGASGQQTVSVPVEEQAEKAAGVSGTTAATGTSVPPAQDQQSAAVSEVAPVEADSAVKASPAKNVAETRSDIEPPASDTEPPARAAAPTTAQQAAAVERPEPLPARRAQASTASPAEAASARRERLQEAAEQRFSRQLAEAQSTPVRPRPAPPATVAAAEPVLASQPKTSVPVEKQAPRPTAAEIKDTLLRGRWYSGNNPASLLPSEKTFCDSRRGNINCVSVPQRVKSQYGPALYKVETELSGFSAAGLFEMSYRTLVRLVDNDTAGSNGDEAWQVTEYSMSCSLSGSDRVSCLDGKGITREYRRRPR